MWLQLIFVLQTDALYVTDPAALHAILVRDQNTFRESTEFAGYIISLPCPFLSTDFVAVSLFGIIHRGDGVASVWGWCITIITCPVICSSCSPSSTGHEHKKQRKLIDPIFTAARIAKLTPLFYQVASQVNSSHCCFDLLLIPCSNHSCNRLWQQMCRQEGAQLTF